MATRKPIKKRSVPATATKKKAPAASAAKRNAPAKKSAAAADDATEVVEVEAEADAASNGEATAERGSGRRATAQSMASKQRDISVSEFFAKNRHLLGFDNPRKALLTTIKEAVDNSRWMSRGRSEFGARMWSSRPGPQSGLAHAALGRLQ